MGQLGSAAGTFGSMMKNIPANRAPGPTAGGAIMAGLGGAGTMAAIGGTKMGASALATMGMGGAMGLGVGAALGIGAYLLS